VHPLPQKSYGQYRNGCVKFNHQAATPPTTAHYRTPWGPAATTPATSRSPGSSCARWRKADARRSRRCARHRHPRRHCCRSSPPHPGPWSRRVRGAHDLGRAASTRLHRRSRS
jgi:hypothetical protein